MKDAERLQQNMRSRRMARLRAEGKTIGQFAERDLQTGLNLLLRHFIYPQRKKVRVDPKEVLASSLKSSDHKIEAFELPFGKVKLQAWRCENSGNGPKVAFFHDWEQDSAYWLDYVPAMLDKGCTLYFLDAPASGHSPGHRLALRDYINAILSFHEYCGPWDSAAGHGLGAAALVQSMAMLPQDQRVRRLATLGMYLDSEEIFSNKLLQMGIDEKLQLWFWRKLKETPDEETETGPPIPLDAYDNAQALARLENIKGLLVHDRQDERYPYSDAEQLAAAWPGSECWAVEGFGHELRGLAVQQKLVPFLGASSFARAA